jgi:hypothetical protein
VCGCLWCQNPKGSKMKKSDFVVQEFQISEQIQCNSVTICDFFKFIIAVTVILITCPTYQKTWLCQWPSPVFAGYTLFLKQTLHVGKFSSRMKLSWLLVIDLDTKTKKINQIEYCYKQTVSGFPTIHYAQQKFWIHNKNNLLPLHILLCVIKKSLVITQT